VHRALGLVLDALVLQPLDDELAVGVGLAPRQLHPHRVEAVEDGDVQGRPPPAQRVEQPHRTGTRRIAGTDGSDGTDGTAGGQRDVDEQAGELLVGLPGVAGDGQDVVVPPQGAVQRDRAEPAVVLDLEDGLARRGARHQRRGWPFERTDHLEHHVVDAGDRHRLHAGHHLTQRQGGDGPQLGRHQRRRGRPVHAIGRRRREHRVAPPVSHRAAA
jgi:hypothetical protein